MGTYRRKKRWGRVVISFKKRHLHWGLSTHRRSEETGGGRGVKKLEKWGDVIYGWSLTIFRSGAK